MTTEVFFNPNARLMIQLGEQLIRNEYVAILELIKNSYDAFATEVVIEMSAIQFPSRGKIIVKDNGCGMDKTVIEEAWLNPGTDYKVKQLLGKRRGDFPGGRIPLGEKGIGRFAVQKMGDKVEITTRKANSEECLVKADWRKFDSATSLSKVPVHFSERAPEVFKGKSTGTMMCITDLRKGQWSEEVLQDLRRAIINMTSPFSSVQNFTIKLFIDGKQDDLDVKDILKSALYSFSCDIKGDRITRFEYKFRPYASMQPLKERTITLKDLQKHDLDRIVYKRKKSAKNGDKKEPEKVDLSSFRVGRVNLDGFIFHREAKVLKLGAIAGASVRDFLKDNGGVRVYRDKIRVYDYGEPGNDWLGLEFRRINDPGVKLNSSLMLAAVNLDREESQDLMEKTNREGFVENDAFKALTKAVLHVITVVEKYRDEDKETVREFCGLGKKSEPVLDILSDFQALLEEKITDEKLRDECITYIKKIDTDYRQMQEILLTSAEAGLGLSFAIHEISKVLQEMREFTKHEKVSEKILKGIRHLSELVEMYAVLLRTSKQKVQDLRKLLHNATVYLQYRLRAHQITLVDNFSEFPRTADVKCPDRFAISAVVNVIDNSIYWLERYEVPNKKIYVSLEDKGDYYRVIVADNGKGFTMSPEQMVKPFVTLKPGGMGLGLHIVSEVMGAQGGKLIFSDDGKIAVPKDYRTGAILALDFKKEK